MHKPGLRHQTSEEPVHVKIDFSFVYLFNLVCCGYALVSAGWSLLFKS